MFTYFIALSTLFPPPQTRHKHKHRHHTTKTYRPCKPTPFPYRHSHKPENPLQVQPATFKKTAPRTQKQHPTPKNSLTPLCPHGKSKHGTILQTNKPTDKNRANFRKNRPYIERPNRHNNSTRNKQHHET